MFRKFLVAACTAAFAALASCGGFPQERATVLTVAGILGETGELSQEYRQLIDAFSRENPDIKVVDRSGADSAECLEKLAESVGAGSTYDVMYLPAADLTPEWVNAEDFVTVEQIRKEYPDYASSVLDWALDSARAGETAYAVPVSGYFEAVFCNMDLFESYGLDLPSSAEEFAAVCAAFFDNGVIPVAAGLADRPDYLLGAVLASRGEGLTESTAGWALDVIRDLARAGFLPASSAKMDSRGALELFNSGKAAMLAYSSSYLADSGADALEDVVAMPGLFAPEEGRLPVTARFCAGFCITRAAWDDPERRSAAVKFVEYMTMNDSLAAFNQNLGLPPAELPDGAGRSPIQESVFGLARLAAGVQAPVSRALGAAEWEIMCSGLPRVAFGVESARDVLEKVFGGYAGSG